MGFTVDKVCIVESLHDRVVLYMIIIKSLMFTYKFHECYWAECEILIWVTECVFEVGWIWTRWRSSIAHFCLLIWSICIQERFSVCIRLNSTNVDSVHTVLLDWWYSFNPVTCAVCWFSDEWQRIIWISFSIREVEKTSSLSSFPSLLDHLFAYTIVFSNIYLNNRQYVPFINKLLCWSQCF